jgi:hypothetical protein
MRDTIKGIEAAGFVVLPKEPTQEMISIAHAVSTLRLGEDVPEALWEERRREELANVYRFMITPAPPPPSLAGDLFEICKDLSTQSI